MTLRILFVDDTWDALDEIERLAKPKRDRWEMHFACGANDALRTIAKARSLPDVVVSEFALTGSDGVQLARQLADVAPDALRLLHSHDASAVALCRSIPWVHHFMIKPVIIDQLQAVIDHLRADPTAHESHVIARLIEPLDRLPVLPKTYERITELAAQPDFAIKDIGEAVRADVALTTATLKLVNSSFFGLRADVTSVEQAIGLLGLDVLKGLVLATQPIGSELPAVGRLDLGALSTYCQDVSALARALAREGGLSVREQSLAFLAGMVHCVGLLIVATNPDVDLPPHRELFGPVDLDVDRKVFRTDRYALSTYLLRVWEFEPSIVRAVAGLGMPRGIVTDPIAETLRLAIHLIENCEFSVTAYIAGDEDTVALVREAAERHRAESGVPQPDAA